MGAGVDGSEAISLSGGGGRGAGMGMGPMGAGMGTGMGPLPVEYPPGDKGPPRPLDTVTCFKVSVMCVLPEVCLSEFGCQIVFVSMRCLMGSGMSRPPARGDIKFATGGAVTC